MACPCHDFEACLLFRHVFQRRLEVSNLKLEAAGLVLLFVKDLTQARLVLVFHGRV